MIPERSVRTVAVMSQAWRSRTAVGLGVVMLAQGIIALVLASLDHQLSADNCVFAAGILVFAAFAARLKDAVDLGCDPERPGRDRAADPGARPDRGVGQISRLPGIS
jgi:hypothetical protein